MDNDKSGALYIVAEKRKGYTQRQLAEALHVSDKAVSKWERGFNLDKDTTPSLTLTLLNRYSRRAG